MSMVHHHLAQRTLCRAVNPLGVWGRARWRGRIPSAGISRSTGLFPAHHGGLGTQFPLTRRRQVPRGLQPLVPQRLLPEFFIDLLQETAPREDGYPGHRRRGRCGRTPPPSRHRPRRRSVRGVPSRPRGCGHSPPPGNPPPRPGRSSDGIRLRQGRPRLQPASRR